MRKNIEYEALIASAILLLVISVPFLQVQMVAAKKHHSDDESSDVSSDDQSSGQQSSDDQSSDSSSGDQQGSFSDRHPTLCSIGPEGATLLGHPGIGLGIKGLCSTK